MESMHHLLLALALLLPTEHDFVVHDFRVRARWRRDVECPGSTLSSQSPSATGVARDRHDDNGAFFRTDVSIRYRQRSHKGIQNRSEESRLLQARLPDRVSDVLLMMPPFGVFPREIEPDGRGIGTSPTHHVPDCVGIEGVEVGGDLRSCQCEKLREQAGADSS